MKFAAVLVSVLLSAASTEFVRSKPGHSKPGHPKSTFSKPPSAFVTLAEESFSDSSAVEPKPTDFLSDESASDFASVAAKISCMSQVEYCQFKLADIDAWMWQYSCSDLCELLAATCGEDVDLTDCVVSSHPNQCEVLDEEPDVDCPPDDTTTTTTSLPLTSTVTRPMTASESTVDTVSSTAETSDLTRTRTIIIQPPITALVKETFPTEESHVGPLFIWRLPFLVRESPKEEKVSNSRS